MKNPFIRCRDKRRLFIFTTGMLIGRFGIIIHEFNTKDEYAVLILKDNEATSFKKDKFNQMEKMGILTPYRKIRRVDYNVCKAEYELKTKTTQSYNRRK